MPTLATLNDGASPLLNSKLNEALANKNANGVSVITVCEHSSDITALVYVRGSMSNPDVVKVVRVNSNIKEQFYISNIIEELSNYERQGYREADGIVEHYAGKELFSTVSVQDFDTYRELKERYSKRGNSQKSNTDSQSKQNRARGDEQNSRVSQAELENSAFSNGEERLT